MKEKHRAAKLEECGKTFKGESDTHRHMKAKHGDVKC